MTTTRDSLRAMCIFVPPDAGDDPDRKPSVSWCGRRPKEEGDKFVLSGASEALGVAWTMNGVSICKACGEQVVKILSSAFETKEEADRALARTDK